MYLMYVDESGDSGLRRSPTRYFALSGVVVHESHWRVFLEQLVAFRKTIKRSYDFPVRAEIHASEFIYKPVGGLPRRRRLAILRNFADELAKMEFVSVTNVVIDKSNKPDDYDVFTTAWKLLFQRFENTLCYGNFPGQHQQDHGIVFTDNTDGRKLVRLVRKMSVYNRIPNLGGGDTRNVPITRILEDPHGKDSKDSLPIQAADLCAYLLYQLFDPNSYIRRTGSQKYFTRLSPILNRRASSSHEYGIVVL